VLVLSIWVGLSARPAKERKVGIEHLEDRMTGVIDVGQTSFLAERLVDK
jgi:hypothetical protein